MRIVFMGTPEFAVAALAALIADGLEVVAVVTAPDRPAGRGLKMHESAVKQYARSQGLPVLQPVRLKDPDFLESLAGYRADLQVVVAFRMLPEKVWDMPPEGTINLHASLLPQYRGAAPINRAIMDGASETGVTTFKLQHEIDTGQIIDRQVVSIGPHETAGELHDRLMAVGAALLVGSVRKIQNGQVQFTPQPATAGAGEAFATAPKIFKEDAHIDWTGEVSAVYNQIRGLSPYPGAWTTLNGQLLKIFAVQKEESVEKTSPGQVYTDHKTFLKIACNKGYIQLKVLQPSGKKKMAIEDFLRGFRGHQLLVE